MKRGRRDRGGGGTRSGRVDDENLLGDLVCVHGDVMAVDDEGVITEWHREELEILEEPGLDGAREGGEARDIPIGWIGWGSIMEDTLFEWERGARDAPLGLGRA